MRHPPAFQIDVRMGRAWRWAVSVLTAASAASFLWWFAWLWHPRTASLPLGALLIGAISTLVAVLLERRLHQLAPESLRWDGQSWLLGSAASRGNEERQGELLVMLDLGDWLLLRHTDVAPRRFRRHRSYLALSRADLPSQWNVLRATLYSQTDQGSSGYPGAGIH